MGDIYRHSQCNIAASDAANSEIGCLYPRNPRTVEPEVIGFRSDWGCDPRVLLNLTDIYGDHVLYTRAWVLQEAVLAPRTLVYGKGQLFWRCRRMRASELFPRGVPPDASNLDHPASALGDLGVVGKFLITNVRIIEDILRRGRSRGFYQYDPTKDQCGNSYLSLLMPGQIWSECLRR
jgi:hypothetical protein